MRRKPKTVQPETPISPPRRWWPLVLVLGYAALVLALDTFAGKLASSGLAPWFPWWLFRWRLENGIDLSKFILWFLVPLLASIWGMDWGAWGVRRWKRRDIYLLVFLIAGGVAAVLIIPLFPSLRSTYHSMATEESARKWLIFRNYTVYTFSWLLGWEFLHRYVILRHVSARWPRYGWLVVPVFEGVYHLQKPLIEAAGMVGFSLIATPWALKRRNWSLPFLAHLAIELELMISLLFI